MIPLLTPLLALAAVLGSASGMPSSPFRHRAHAQAKRQAQANLVVAHHMVGNTYPYTQQNWASDIALANESGLDGFALNIGSDSWQPTQVASAYAAAAASGTDFKLFISFDMSALPCTSASNAQALQQYITQYASHPNQLIVNGKVFASTFSGESCTFGQGSVQSGWQYFLSGLTGANAVQFAPSFFVDPSTFGGYGGVLDGIFNWNGAWDIALTTQSIQSSLGSLVSNIAGTGNFSGLGSLESTLNQSIQNTFSTDTTYLNGLEALNLGSQTYIASVSPWFFTHYSPQTYNKNWIYLADFHLYPTRWETLIAQRASVQIAEVVSWNDFGESHYIGPIEGAQPNSQAWVDGMNHTGFLDMTSYYAQAFKTGSYPQITEDKLYMWARPHPKDATAAADSVAKPTNYELDQDTLWALVMATAPGSLTLSTADGTSQTFDVVAGVNKLSVPLTPGGYMHGVLERNGQTVIDLQPQDYTFETNPQTYNYNAFMAYAGSG